MLKKTETSVLFLKQESKKRCYALSFLGSTNKTTKGMTIIISHNLLWECTGQRVNGRPNG